jgi:hypothetical protein
LQAAIAACVGPAILTSIPGAPPWHGGCSPAEKKGRVVYDLLFLVVTIGFFALSLLYVNGCERL